MMANARPRPLERVSVRSVFREYQFVVRGIDADVVDNALVQP